MNISPGSVGIIGAARVAQALGRPVEVERSQARARSHGFHDQNVLARFRKEGDLFAPVLGGGQRLESALKKLQ